MNHSGLTIQQPGPLLKLAWDAVFSDEDIRVTETIRELEAALRPSSA